MYKIKNCRYGDLEGKLHESKLNLTLAQEIIDEGGDITGFPMLCKMHPDRYNSEIPVEVWQAPIDEDGKPTHQPLWKDKLTVPAVVDTDGWYIVRLAVNGRWIRASIALDVFDLSGVQALSVDAFKAKMEALNNKDVV